MAADPKKIEAQLKRLDKLSRDLGESNPFSGMDPSVIARSTSEARKLELALDAIEDKVASVNQSFTDLEKQLSATILEISKGPKATTKFANSMKGINSEVKKLRYEEEGISNLNIKQLQQLKKRALQKTSDAKQSAQEIIDEAGLQAMVNGKIDKRTKEYRNLSDVQKAAIAFLENEDDTVKSINAKIDQRIKKEEEVNKKLGNTGALLSGIEGFLKKIGLGDLASSMGFNDINEELREFAKTAPDSQAVFQKSIELTGAALEKALKDPLVQVAIAAKVFAASMKATFGALIKSIKALEESSGKLAKNLNISAAAARELTSEYANAAVGSDRLFVSSEGLAESVTEINDALGTQNIFNAENLATFTALKKTAGLTGEEMMGIQKLSLATGKSFDEIADATLTQVEALNESSGIQINSKKVLADISNISAATQLSLSKNPKSLAAAVQTARSLGIELSKVEDISDSLLNFESSIKDELAAELLIGKNINLEKARQAALNNDLETVAIEIAKQAGSAAEFGKMNRIQQEALAQAVGMSRDELGETLFIQEQLAGASGKDKENRQKLLESLTEQYGVAKATKMVEEKGLDNLMNQASVSEKMSASFSKIGELVTKIANSFAPFVEMLGNAAAFIGESKILLSGLVGIMTALGVALAVVSGKLLLNFAISVGKMFASVVGGMSQLGPPGVIAGLALGGAAVAGAYAAYQGLKGDDIVSPGANMSGYGKRTLLAPEGSIALNNNDTVIAGTNLGGGGGGGTDMSKTNALLETMARGLSRQKPVPLYQITRG